MSVARGSHAVLKLVAAVCLLVLMAGIATAFRDEVVRRRQDAAAAQLAGMFHIGTPRHEVELALRSMSAGFYANPERQLNIKTGGQWLFGCVCERYVYVELRFGDGDTLTEVGTKERFTGP